MKIVLNATQFKPNSSGIGMMVRYLFGSLTKRKTLDCTVILSKDSPAFPQGPNVTAYRIPYAKGTNLRRLYFQTFRMGKLFCSNAILLAPDSKFPLLLPRTCHPIPIVTDLAMYCLPETYKRSRVLLWRMQYWFLQRRVSRWIAISEHTKHDLMERFGIAQDRIDVVYCAADSQMVRCVDTQKLEQIRQKYQLPEHYILFVGNHNPRKNLSRLLMAFELLKAQTTLPHQLVIVGENGWLVDMASETKRLKYADEVVFIGYVQDEDMPAVYSMADLFAFPTLYEGFGIPLIEAQQCGVPVLTSNLSSLPEVGGAGALYVDPYQPEDISNGMRKVLEDARLAQSLTKIGYENAKRFSWEKAGEKLEGIVLEEIGRAGLRG